MPAWFWAMESSAAASANTGVAINVAQAASRAIFFMGFPLWGKESGRPAGSQKDQPDARSLLLKWQRLPDTRQILAQRLRLRTGGRRGIRVLVLLDHGAVEGQAGLGARAGGPHHHVAAMGGGGAFRAG